MRQTVTSATICLLFVALGIFALRNDGPVVIAWLLIIFFGFGLVLFPIAAIYEKKTGRPLQFFGPKSDTATADDFTLQEGKFYKLHVNDDLITLTNKATHEEKKVSWEKLTDVFVIAIDEYPIGKCSYVLHHGDDFLEVPIDTEGNEELLIYMQNKLAGFDNKAFIEAMAMKQGHKRLWPKKTNKSSDNIIV